MNKNAIVTGGTRGIGRAVSIALAQKGVNVFALYARNNKAADSLIDFSKSNNLNITTLRGDLTRDNDFQKVVGTIKEKCESIDIIVHSAASGVHRDVASLTAKHLKWTYEINVISIHKLILEFIDAIPDNGRIIGITSTGGIRVLPFYGAVGSSKGALESLFRHYAVEFAKKNISVNLVCPGMVATEAINAFPDKDERIDKCVSNTPTGKMTTTEEVAELVEFLCLSHCASQIVGQTLIIDGGKTILS